MTIIIPSRGRYTIRNWLKNHKDVQQHCSKKDGIYKLSLHHIESAKEVYMNFIPVTGFDNNMVIKMLDELYEKLMKEVKSNE